MSWTGPVGPPYWGVGFWESGINPSNLSVNVPYLPGAPDNVTLIPSMSVSNTYLANPTLNLISAQANPLGNEIDIFINNPNNKIGTLVRNMFRYPINIGDGQKLIDSQPLKFYADWGLLGETMYYYKFFPTDSTESPLQISCQSTSCYDFSTLIWENYIPEIYRDKDAEANISNTLSTSVSTDTQTGLRSIGVYDTTVAYKNQTIQVGDEITTIRSIDYMNMRFAISPPLQKIPEPNTPVITQGMGFPLKRFLKVYAESFDYMFSRIKALKNNRDIRYCDDRYINNFARMIGLSQIINTGNISDVRSSRSQVENFIVLLKIKGTINCIKELVQQIVGPNYLVTVDTMKDYIMFTNSYNSLNDSQRNDNTPNPNNPTTYTNQGKPGDLLRYTPDPTSSAIYAPYVVRITIRIFSNFSVIPGYTNSIAAIIPLFLPANTTYYLLWDTTQGIMNFTGSGFGATFTPTVTP